jgi:hypothetical protein
VYLGVIFSKINEMSLSPQEKQLIIFVAINKIKSFQWKLEFWKTCVHDELNNFTILKDFLHGISGTIDEWNFSPVLSTVSTFGISA